MGRIIIEPHDQEEKALIQAMLKRMNIKAQYLSDEDLEDYVVAQETLEGNKTERVSEKAVLDILKGKDEG